MDVWDPRKRISLREHACAGCSPPSTWWCGPQARAAAGSLDRIARVVKLTGFVASTPDFTDQPEVINGCSDLMVEVFGDKGRHARAAVSAAALPRGVAVEIEAIFQIER